MATPSFGRNFIQSRKYLLHTPEAIQGAEHCCLEQFCFQTLGYVLQQLGDEVGVLAFGKWKMGGLISIILEIEVREEASFRLSCRLTVTRHGPIILIVPAALSCNLLVDVKTDGMIEESDDSYSISIYLYRVRSSSGCSEWLGRPCDCAPEAGSI